MYQTQVTIRPPYMVQIQEMLWDLLSFFKLFIGALSKGLLFSGANILQSLPIGLIPVQVQSEQI